MSKHILNKTMILTITILFLTQVVPANNLGGELLNKRQSNDFQVEYTITFSKEDIQFSKIDSYDAIYMDDCEYLTEIDMPMIPMKTIYLALPSDMYVENIVVEEYNSIELEGLYDILPATNPFVINELNDENQNDFLAKATYLSVKQYPIKYTPNTKKLTLYNEITIILQGTNGYICGDYLPTTISERARADIEKTIKQIVENDNSIQLSTSTNQIRKTSLPPDGPFDHIIITSELFESEYNPLVDWHTKKGIRDTVVTTEYIYSNYDGSTNQEKIRNFVIDAYNNWGTQYILIAGEDETVPFEYRTYYQDSTPSDQYYSDFDDDWIHELYVGRVSADSPEQINCFINKVLSYEKNPPLYDYVENVLLIGMDLFQNTRGQDLKDTIDEYISTFFDVTKVYDSHPGNHKEVALAALNSGQHLINHADHGLSSKIGVGDVNHGLRITNYDVDQLTNDNRLSILVTLACLPNKMDSEDCFAEHFVIYNENQAGVAFVGNTRNGWGYIGYPEELSGRLDREWWEGLLQEDIYNIGQTLVYSKHQFPTGSPDIEVKRHCEWEFSLLGEPEMPIWTDTPTSIEVSHPIETPVGFEEFTVHVEEEGGTNLQDAYVCLYKEGDLYERDYTDSNGDVTFSISPISGGSLYVTVTKHNYLPYESEAIVIPGGEYPYVPNTPVPENNADDIIDFDTDLSWIGGDPQGDPVTYDVYFGTTNPPPLVSFDITNTYYNPGMLEYDTNYFWRISADDNNGQITFGPTWKFSTVSENYIQVESSNAVLGQNNKIVNVYGSWAEPIKAFQIYLSFDSLKLEFVEVDFAGTVGENADYALGNEMESGIISFGAVWFTEGYPDAGSGLLAKIVFNVITTELGDISLDIFRYDGNPFVFTDELGFSIYPDDVDGVLTIVDDNLICGDANNDGVVNVSDAVFIINYVFVPGSPIPTPLCVGDANGDGMVNISDAVYIINYVFIPGFPPPMPDCCDPPW